MKDLISIIVPVYNAEKYLNRCIESIINQTYKNLEIILVNDGSKDLCGQICDEYSVKDSRIKVFHNTNHGVSYSRNYGIKQSSGQYLMFIDADDFIDLDYISKMYNIILNNDYEVVFTNHVLDYGNNKIIKNFVSKELQNSCDISYPKYINLYFNSYVLSSSCKILFNKNIVSSNKIEFNEKMKYGEDMLFSFMLYTKSKKTYFLNDYGYHYYIHNLSSSHSSDINKKIKYCNDNLQLYKTIKNIFDDEKIEFDYIIFLDAILRNLNYAFNDIVSLLNDLKSNEINELLTLYRNYLNDFKFSKSKLNNKLKIEIILLKYNIKLYSFYIKLKRKLKGKK